MKSEVKQSSHPNGTAETTNRNGGIPEGDNVDRIRDILFGSQMRDYEGRFQRLEERLSQDAAALRTDLQKQLETLESFMKGAVESLTNRIKTEQSGRTQALDKFARDLGETAKVLEAKMTQLDEQSAMEVAALRQQLLEQSKAFHAELKAKHDQIKAGLDQEAQLIRGAMTGRESLAEMFSEVALRLKGEFHIPGDH